MGVTDEAVPATGDFLPTQAGPSELRPHRSRSTKHMSDPAGYIEEEAFALSPEDAAALDAALNNPQNRTRSEEINPVQSGQFPKVVSLLGLLRLSAGEERSLRENAPLAIGGVLHDAHGLSSAGKRAVESFAAGEEPIEAVRVLELMDHASPEIEEDRAARIERVLAALGTSDGEKKGRRVFRMSPPSAGEVYRTRRIRFSDLVAVAAVLLVGTTILFPQLFSVRSMTEEIRCAQNMQRAGLGFSLFANEHDGHLPARDPGSLGDQRSGQWWLVGNPSSSHSANLFVLVRHEYVPLEALACPGNERAVVDHDKTLEADWQSQEQVSYSYQLFDGRPPRFSDPGIKLLLADRSPVISRAMRGETVDATENSHNHRGRGQNLLLPNFAVYFAYSPEMQTGAGDDNIWIPRSHEGDPGRVRLTGSERPAPSDAFVGP